MHSGSSNRGKHSKTDSSRDTKDSSKGNKTDSRGSRISKDRSKA